MSEQAVPGKDQETNLCFMEEFRRTIKKHPDDFQANTIAYAHFAAQVTSNCPIDDSRPLLAEAYTQLFPDPSLMGIEINK